MTFSKLDPFDGRVLRCNPLEYTGTHGDPLFRNANPSFRNTVFLFVFLNKGEAVAKQGRSCCDRLRGVAAMYLTAPYIIKFKIDGRKIRPQVRSKSTNM